MLEQDMTRDAEALLGGSADASGATRRTALKAALGVGYAAAAVPLLFDAMQAEQDPAAFGAFDRALGERLGVPDGGEPRFADAAVRRERTDLWRTRCRR